MTENKDKVAYIDFKSLKKDRKKQPAQDFHSNPVINKLFKLMHSKLSDNKEDYKSYTEFNPEDLV